MDPNANLAEQIRLARFLQNEAYIDTRGALNQAERLAALVLALDEWISNSGFIPKEWQK
jgi:hypothetical protein